MEVPESEGEFLEDNTKYSRSKLIQGVYPTRKRLIWVPKDLRPMNGPSLE